MSRPTPPTVAPKPKKPAQTPHCCDPPGRGDLISQTNASREVEEKLMTYDRRSQTLFEYAKDCGDRGSDGMDPLPRTGIGPRLAGDWPTLRPAGSRRKSGNRLSLPAGFSPHPVPKETDSPGNSCIKYQDGGVLDVNVKKTAANGRSSPVLERTSGPALLMPSVPKEEPPVPPPPSTGGLAKPLGPPPPPPLPSLAKPLYPPPPPPLPSLAEPLYPPPPPPFPSLAKPLYPPPPPPETRLPASPAEPLTNSSLGTSLPSTWEPMPRDENGNDVTVYSTKLTAESSENKEVEKLFQRTAKASAMTIISVERIQNPYLYQVYQMRKQKMDRDNGGNNERRLFHGTHPGNLSKINTQGFNRSFSGLAHGTRLGKGVYFARDASFAKSYASGGVGDQFMYLARVLVGQYCKGDPAMVVPPPKDPSRPEILFDSVVDQKENPRIFVVFFDSQCYPEYLIRFKELQAREQGRQERKKASTNKPLPPPPALGGNVDNNWKRLFDMVGVTADQMKGKETMDFIYDFVEKMGGIENVTREIDMKQAAPTPPQPARGPASRRALPPTPPSRGAPPPSPAGYGAPLPSPPSRGGLPPPPPSQGALPPPPPMSRAPFPPQGGGNNNKKGGGKRKLTKEDIGKPKDFQHVGHIGWDPQAGFDIDNVEMDNNWKRLFDMVGVTADQMKEKETMDFIYDFVEKMGGIENVTREIDMEQTAPIPPQPARGPASRRALPPTPLSRGAPPPSLAGYGAPLPPPPSREGDAPPRTSNGGEDDGGGI